MSFRFNQLDIQNQLESEEKQLSMSADKAKVAPEKSKQEKMVDDEKVATINTKISETQPNLPSVEPNTNLATPRYGVFEVLPEWIFEPEDTGAKPKFWFRIGDAGANWLFKHPRPNTGEHWAEKIAAEVAGSLGVDHAEVELATYDGSRGSVTKSFDKAGFTLFHGNQIMVESDMEYRVDARFGQSQHTLANIWQALETQFPENRVESAMRQFAEYLTLDALIGNVDRHHENWGVQRSLEHVSEISLAPSFDHASSLGRELTDTRREWLLSENGVGRYSERGRGGIYWSEDEGRGPSPLELTRRAASDYPARFSPALRRLRNWDESVLSEIVRRVPTDWMSETARKFATALMLYNLGELRKIPL